MTSYGLVEIGAGARAAPVALLAARAWHRSAADFHSARAGLVMRVAAHALRISFGSWVPSVLILSACASSVVDEREPGADAGGLPEDCVDLFAGGVPAVCCPDPIPDCSVLPDGYPGYHCVSKHNGYCSCSCAGGEWMCAC